ncbi:MAG: radical SAM protein [Kiritimatiellae bacterium]|nr:radical SAM protein [Kiritimatiellia bacterium]
MTNARKHLFGPVPSRRFGRSLGVDLTPFKTCTLDCIFCQLGRTTNRTLARQEYVPTAEVEAEIDAWLKDGGKADYITLAGSGEPTLHSRFGEVIRYARERAGMPVALLSNGTLFALPEVREAAQAASVVKLSLSAWDQDSFEHVNRPHPGLNLARMVEGYRAFRREFQGKLWMEVFLIGGTNSVPRDVERIAALVESIAPDEIHLNTAVRPPAEEFAFPVPRREMEALAGLFTPAAKAIAEFPSDKSADVAANEGTILAMLRRRPCTAQQIAGVFGMHPNEVSKYVGKLLRTGKVRAQTTGPDVYYVAGCGRDASREGSTGKRER